MELKIKQQAKGTRIIGGEEAKKRRTVLNKLIAVVDDLGFNEIILPVVEKASLYTDKAGKEVLDQMFTFVDKSSKKRILGLRPEGTATIQAVANKHYKQQKDVKLWYFTRCYRYERPQKGRYREFWQFGIEIINPRNKEEAYRYCKAVASALCEQAGMNISQYKSHEGVKRGLAYYEQGKGFEIIAEELGAQKQICGGGMYKEGVGFAIGFDRLMLCL